MAQHETESRHRDKNGEISKKYGNTLMSTLRKSYGADLPRVAVTTKGSATHRLDEPSLSQLITDHGAGRLSEICR